MSETPKKQTLEEHMMATYGAEWKTRLAVGTYAITYNLLSRVHRFPESDLPPDVMDGIDCLYSVIYGVMPEYFE